jgi:MFS family permease
MIAREMTSSAAGAAGGSHPAARHTLIACFLGYTLNAMDVQILGQTMSAIPGVTKAGVVFISTATLLNSAFGGWLAGWLSDRIGRVRTLKYMIACYAVFTFLGGCAPDYASFFVTRVLMAIGFGGQWAAAAVMVGEAAPAARRGLWVGVMQSGWAAGWAIAVSMPLMLHTLLPSLPQDVLWRVPFWIGLSPILLIPYVHLFVKESTLFLDRHRLRAAGEKTGSFEIFSPGRLRTTSLTCLLSIGAQSGYYGIVLWLPAFLAERGFELFGWYLVTLIGGSLAGYLVSAWFSDLDLFKRRGNFVLFAAGAIIISLVIIVYKADETIILLLAFWLGFFSSGTFAGIGAFLTELFPTDMRGSGVGFSYNFGRGFAALVLWLIPWLAGTGVLPASLAIPPLGLSIFIFVLIAYGCVIIAALQLHETKGKSTGPDPYVEAPDGGKNSLPSPKAVRA